MSQNVNQPGQCQKCGTPLDPGAAEGLCPGCLLALNLATQTEIPGDNVGPNGTKIIQPAPQAPPSPSEIAKYFPQLEIVECLGRGGMGVVYKARQPKLNRFVALKILAPERGSDPKFAERFLREAQTLARLNHPNIIAVYDFGETDGLYYLVMEYVDGVSLRQLIQSRKITPEEALSIVPRICEALQFAHGKGVVHRDIKPENVLLDKEGQVKIADFGIAKIIGAEVVPAFGIPPSGGSDRLRPGLQTPVNLTQDQVVGTPHYMAPEQVEHPQRVDHRADIYSLGVVFYELLTGELPGKSIEPPSRKVEIDVRLDQVVLRALEREPERRYQQASQVKSDVETIVTTPSPRSNVQSPTPPPVANPETSPKAQTAAHFSRTAIVGAFWSIFVLPALAFFFLARIEGGPGQTPTTWARLLAFSLVPLGITAPFGTTILGWIAISQIRRSAGRLHGLGLATFDALLFPMLLVTGLIGLPITGAFRGSPIEGFIIGMPIAGFIGWRIWRRISRSVESQSRSTSLAAKTPASNWLKRSTISVCIALVVFVLIRIFAIEPFKATTDAAAPEVPKGSKVLVWRPARSFSPGNIIVYRDYNSDRKFLGRVIGQDSGSVIVSRNGETNLAVNRSLVRGRVISVYWRAQPEPEIAERPDILRTLSTAEVIRAGLAKPKSAWPCLELATRARDGRLTAPEAGTYVDGLSAYFERTFPNGSNEPLNWQHNLFDELRKRNLVTNAQMFRFMDAFEGKPSFESVPRLREMDRSMSLVCHTRSIWGDRLFGLTMLNYLRAITIDGVPILLPKYISNNWRMDRLYCQLDLPHLNPGKHELKCMVETAWVAEEDLAGLAADAPPADWPPAKRRWTRTGVSELMVYAKGAQIVGLTQQPGLDPVAAGALSVNPIIIRAKGNRSRAIVQVNADGSKLPVAVSFDVALRVNGKTYPCGDFCTSGLGMSGTPTQYGSEMGCDLDPLPASIQQADLVLTPNTSHADKVAGIDPVWGKEVVFRNVPLKRQDLAGTGTAQAGPAGFGPVIEQVVSGSSGDIDLDRDVVLPEPAGLRGYQAILDWAKLSGADAGVWLSVVNDQVVDGALEAMDMLTASAPEAAWEQMSPASLKETLESEVTRTGQALPSLTKLGTRNERGLGVVWLFKTREGSYGMLQLVGLSNNPRGVKIRYKMVQDGTAETLALPKPFGPAAEFEISRSAADNQGLIFFDMETGQSFKPPFPLKLQNRLPDMVELTPELKSWIAAHEPSPDILFRLGEKNWEMMNIEMQEQFAGQPAEWNSVSPEKAMAIFAKMDARHFNSGYVPTSSGGHSYGNGFSTVEAFRTRANKVGVYQIKGIAERDGRSVFIRRKLVQDPTPDAQNRFSVSHRAKLGQKALDACRDFVEEHQWQMQSEYGEAAGQVAFKAKDGAGRNVTFTEEQQTNDMARLSIATEPGTELSAQRIGAAICRRLGLAAVNEALEPSTKRPPPAPILIPNRDYKGSAFGHEEQFRAELSHSVPVEKYGYRVQDLRFSADYQKGLVVFAHSDSKARPTWEFTLNSDGFDRYRGTAMQPFYTPGTAETPPIQITVSLPPVPSSTSDYKQSAFGHEKEFRAELLKSIPVQQYGYTLKDLRFSLDYGKVLAVFVHPDKAARPEWEFILADDGFGRYRGAAMQPFYTPGTAETPPIQITVALPQSTSAPSRHEDGVNPAPARKFVRLVMEKDAMTFEGRPASWDRLDSLLATVPDHTNTVLEFAVTSDQITMAQQNEWFNKAILLAKAHGFEYASFIGIHPLGSKGTAASNAPSVKPGETNVLAKQIIGLKLVAERGFSNVDTFHGNKIPNGAGSLMFEFFATEKFTSKHGTTITEGDSFVIGTAEVSECPHDGYTGTKLIFSAAPPNEGLVFYAYGINEVQREFWAINKEEIRRVMKGDFSIEDGGQRTNATSLAPVLADPTSGVAPLLGGTVELLGVAEYPATNKTWWRMDGSPGNENPPVHLAQEFPVGKDEVARQFVIRLKNLPPELSESAWQITPGDNSMTGIRPSVNGAPSPDLRMGIAAFKRSARQATLRLGFASGLWETIVTQDARFSQMTPVNAQDHRWTVDFLTPTQTNKQTSVTVVHTVSDHAVQIVAVDKDGVEHLPTKGHSISTAGLRREMLEFGGLPLAHISKFLFEVRPYHSVEFRNVSLWPKEPVETRRPAASK